jgi:hypothetical protein
LTVQENAGMPENYRFMMDFKICILSIRFKKKVFLPVNANSVVFSSYYVCFLLTVPWIFKKVSLNKTYASVA